METQEENSYDPPMMGAIIKRLREKAGLTQPQLGGKLGVSFQAVSQWENDKTLPSEENILGMVDVFEVRRDVFKGRKPRRTGSQVTPEPELFQALVQAAMEAGIPPQTADRAKELLEELRQEARTPLDRSEGTPDAVQLKIRVQTLLRRHARRQP